MSQFSSKEEVSLEKIVDCSRKIRKTPSEDLENVYEIERCVSWIKENDFDRVCLQFPDYLLPDAARVALKMEEKLGRHVFVLADTAYESCCIDFVAAEHVKANCVIHFGPNCFSKSAAKIPFMNIYDKNNLNVDKFFNVISEKLQDINQQEWSILLDTPYIHLCGDISKRCPNQIQFMDSSGLDVKDKSILFIGDEISKKKLLNLKFNYKPKSLFFYNTDLHSVIEYETDTRILRRRYYLIEKIKDSNTVGIVIGTLGVQNYLEIINRLKKLLSLHHKKYYLISVGKPTVAKLANFQEIDVYVVVTCALNEIYDSRDFFKPIVTPYDVEIALNSESSELQFNLDFNSFVASPIAETATAEGDVSLVSGKIRGFCEEGKAIVDRNESQIALKVDGTVSMVSTHGAGFLANRSWKGLEQALGENEVKLAEEGQKGIAQKYDREME